MAMKRTFPRAWRCLAQLAKGGGNSCVIGKDHGSITGASARYPTFITSHEGLPSIHENVSIESSISSYKEGNQMQSPGTYRKPFVSSRRQYSKQTNGAIKDERYSKVSRDPRFSTISDEDIIEFRKILGDKCVVTDESELEIANTDWMRKYVGKSKVLLRPRTTQQVSEVLGYCNSRKLPVVPQGGNTGLVGGSVPVFDEVILSLSAMNNIISFDEVNGILVCEAGCILENLDHYLSEKGYMMPLDFGAKGSCQIGGNISTNAGGIHLIRYGSLRANVLGLEVVLANGEVIDVLRTLRKDNTGYDLKQLFIGAEGTLGIVTKVSILTPSRLSSKNVAFLSCNSYLNCQMVLKEAKSRLGEILSAFEFLDRSAFDMVLEHSDGSRNPLPGDKQDFYLLVETTGSNQNHDREKLDSFLESCMEQNLVSDGTIALDGQQMASFWHIRETIPEAVSKSGAVYKYDLSIPVPALYDLVNEIRERLGNMATVIGYGHLGDGNLHLNISAPKYDQQLVKKIEPFVYEWTASHKGSISAEHGLGFMKANAIHYSKPLEAVQLMSQFKSLLDNNGILNPYKVLPSSGNC